MDEQGKILTELSSPSALIGTDETRLRALLDAALPEGTALTVLGTASLIDPFLSMKANAAYYRLNMPPEKAARLDELIKLSGLRKREIWEHRFRDNMGGEKQLWRIVFTLLAVPGPVYLPHALEGLTAAQRERLDAILADEAAHGRGLIFSAASLKDIAPMTAVKTVYLAAGDALLPFTPVEIESFRAAHGGDALSYEELASLLIKEGSPC